MAQRYVLPAAGAANRAAPASAGQGAERVPRPAVRIADLQQDLEVERVIYVALCPPPPVYSPLAGFVVPTEPCEMTGNICALLGTAALCEPLRILVS